MSRKNIKYFETADSKMKTRKNMRTLHYTIYNTYIKAVNTEHDTSAHGLVIAVKTSNPEPLRA